MSLELQLGGLCLASFVSKWMNAVAVVSGYCNELFAAVSPDA